ncbi:winged helix-turn-helix transcriptional regulator [Actinomadura rudentiformis]|uniref:Helix-turn-helix transcriptional regulator n=1 Tax=Actinomadura rudentiformis TaxID=359158 RepID=A0A6H9YY21_9ACTN|nr:helix-turn-helix domain-containing protein [Actinomadura rudentiformis]KAB2352354.1 helix-turn-helix transcriptional regulator [Actinomadura rudentiformis]
MAVRSNARRSNCAVAGTLDILGDKWSLLVVRDLLMAGELRNAQLAGSAEGIPTNTLADRLRRLEEADIIERVPYSERPPRFSYRLTERGRQLGPVVNALAHWGERNLPGTRRLGTDPS